MFSVAYSLIVHFYTRYSTAPITLLHSLFFLIPIIVLLDAISSWRIEDLGKLFTLSFLIGLLSEITGILYGFPFGKYHYSEIFPYKLFGLVPIEIPLYWFVIMYTSIRITDIITKNTISQTIKSSKQVLLISLIDAVCATSWDLIMDPVMVNILGAWIWEIPGIIYGIPITNFIGWLIVTYTISLTFRTIRKETITQNTIVPGIIYFQLWYVMVETALINNMLEITWIGSLAMLFILSIYFINV